MAPTIGCSALVFGLALSLSSVLAPPAEARGGHGFGRGFHGGHGIHQGMHCGGLAGELRHADDDCVKAESTERDRLLNTQIKSICRGC